MFFFSTEGGLTYGRQWICNFTDFFSHSSYLFINFSHMFNYTAMSLSSILNVHLWMVTMPLLSSSWKETVTYPLQYSTFHQLFHFDREPEIEKNNCFSDWNLKERLFNANIHYILSYIIVYYCILYKLLIFQMFPFFLCEDEWLFRKYYIVKH